MTYYLYIVWDDTSPVSYAWTCNPHIMEQYASLDIPKLLYDSPFDIGELYTIDAMHDNEFLSVVNSMLCNNTASYVTINDKLDYLDDCYHDVEPLVRVLVPITVEQTEFYYELDPDTIQEWTDALLESLVYFIQLSQFISSDYKPDVIKFLKLLKFYITLYVSLCCFTCGIECSSHLDKLILELQTCRPYEEILPIVVRPSSHEGMIDYINFMELDNSSYRFIMSITRSSIDPDDSRPFIKRMEEVVMLNERWKYLCM